MLVCFSYKSNTLTASSVVIITHFLTIARHCPHGIVGTLFCSLGEVISIPTPCGCLGGAAPFLSGLF